jgi:hypothetical protein
MCIGKGGGMAKTLDKPSLYDTDVVAWLEEQAAIETGLSEAAFPPDLPYALEQLFERELSAAELPAPRSTRKKYPRKKHP